MIEFSALTKSDWIQLVLKELKGQDYDSLVWNLNSRISIDPYYTVEEVDQQMSSLPASNEWLISESFDLGKPLDANNLLLQSLNGGLQSPLFEVPAGFKQADLTLVLKDVELSFLSGYWNFSETANSTFISEMLESACRYGNTDSRSLLGGLFLSNDQIPGIYNKINTMFPNLRFISIAGGTNELKDVDISLSEVLLNVKELIDKVVPADINEFFSKCFFTFSIGKNYLFEIARLRAFSYLWGNFQLAYGIANPEIPFLNVVFDSKAYDEDSNINMISATTLAMSAAIGGASRITVLPSDKAGTSFARRIARNVQHLLVMESGFDKVYDPASGSYFIENMTSKIAASAWSIFVNQSK